MTEQPPILRVGEELPPLESEEKVVAEPSPPASAGPDGPPPPTGAGRWRGKAGDRFRVINAFADNSLAGLSRAELAVWVLLWRDTRQGLARASQADLARRAGVNDRTVKRAIRSLRRSGLLTVVRRGGLFRGPSTYRVNPLRRGAGLAG